MLTEAQKTWIAHLNDADQVTIVPFDPTAEAKYQKVRKEVQSFLKSDISVEHHGATSLGISGQDEIDIYIPVLPDQFDSTTDSLIPLYGIPRSRYPLERARFKTEVDGKKVDVFVINAECEGWRTSLVFEGYLRTHPEVLEAYRQLKEDLAGTSTQEYYRAKAEFINEILANAAF